MFTKEQVKSILDKSNILSAKNFDEMNKEAESNQKDIESYLIEKKIITQQALYEEAAKYFNVPFVNLKEKTIRKDILLSVPEPIAMAHSIIAFDADNKEMQIAALDPGDLEIFEFLKKKTGLEQKIFLTTPESIKEGLKQYHKTLKSEFDYLTKGKKGDKKDGDPSDEQGLKKLAEDLPVVRIVNTLLEYAVFEGASDIHIEPEEKSISVRYRIDGILRNVMTLPKNVQSGIIARIKILSNLKVDEHRLPQDGRFKIQTDEYKVAFRVSILPTFD